MPATLLGLTGARLKTKLASCPMVTVSARAEEEGTSLGIVSGADLGTLSATQYFYITAFATLAYLFIMAFWVLFPV